MTRKKAGRNAPDAGPLSGDACAPGLKPAEWVPQVQVVGVGASAGGVGAFGEFFAGLPADQAPGMAFVLVQHLSPDHKSILTELIRRSTHLPVAEVVDGMLVRANHVYIIPPNRDLVLAQGTLRLSAPEPPRGLRLPIDLFFRSLARDQGDRAIGVVLSGTGSDGMEGLRAIKGEGGMVMVQSLETAEYDGMIRSALSTGLVDLAVPPREMVTRLMAYAGRTLVAAASRPWTRTNGTAEALDKICGLLREQVGHDFSLYKRSTLLRRVERRMAVHELEAPEAYLNLLRGNGAEAQALFRDLLIGVTGFFRDPEAFEALAGEAVTHLFANKAGNAPVRVWVCACATGEEAYSIAILLQEHLETLSQPNRVQIFATDIDPHAIEQARAGVFPAAVAEDMSPERLARYFLLEPDGSYRIRKVVRDMLVFSVHDVIQDPPFSGIDLISCRNLMIYLTAEAQKKLLPMFHYALAPKGVLFLGNSESVGECSSLFQPLVRKQKIFRREDQGGLATMPFAAVARGWTGLHPRGRGAGPEPGLEAADNPAAWVERTLLAHYSQAAVLVDLQGDIQYIVGRTGQYLEPAAGSPGMNILAMAREGLQSTLSAALCAAGLHGFPVRHEGLRVKSNGTFHHVDLTIKPALDPNGTPNKALFLVLLEASPEPGTEAEALERVDLAQVDEKRFRMLEAELKAKEDHIHNLREEMRTSTEELRSANEEMQSMNEELQSTNEEMETSKEELQSINEELATINAELQAKVAGLARANNDMNNFLAGTGVATLFVDHQFRIVRFTPGATEMINLMPVDIGRPVAHIASNLVGYDRLLEDAQAVLRDLVPRGAEVQTTSGVWFMMRFRPYRTLDNVIEGVVITFTSITEQKEAERRAAEGEREVDAILESLGAPLLMLDAREGGDGKADLRIHRVNPALERRLDVRGGEVRGRTLQEVWPRQDFPWLEACRRVLAGGNPETLSLDGSPGQILVFRPATETRRCCVLFRDPPGPGTLDAAPGNTSAP